MLNGPEFRPFKPTVFNTQLGQGSETESQSAAKSRAAEYQTPSSFNSAGAIFRAKNIAEKIYPNTPELIYLNLPTNCFTVLSTLPDKSKVIHIPQNFDENPDSNQISVVLKNNGHITIKRELDLAKMAKKIEEIDGKDFNTAAVLAYDISKQINKPEFKELSISDEFYRISYDWNENLKPEIEKIVFQEKDYTLEEFKKYCNEQFIPEIRNYGLPIFEGEHLFRALRPDEWNRIVDNGFHLIRTRDNFEAKVGDQVQTFLKDEEYAGIVVKVPSKGPFFSMVPGGGGTIRSAYDHFIPGNDIEVSKDGKSFLALDQFLKTTT